MPDTARPLANGAANNNILFCRWANSAGLLYQTYAGGSPQATVHAPGAFTQNAFQVIGVLHGGGEASLRKDGETLVTVGAGEIPVIERSSNLIGKSNWQDPLLQADISEILVYSRKLNVAERDAVEAYLNTKYEVAGPPPAPVLTAARKLSGNQNELVWEHDYATTADLTVERAVAGSEEYATLATVNKGRQSYIDASMAPGVSYSYRMKARGPGGWSEQSNSITPLESADPTPLPLANLRLWLRADAGAFSGATGVFLWADQSPDGRDAVQAAAVSQPALTSMNGLPAAHFDGLDDYLDIAPGFAGVGEAEVFILLRSTGSQVDGSTLWVLGSDYLWGPNLYPWSDGTITDNFGSSGQKAAGLPAEPLNEWHLYNASSKAGEWVNRINGNEQFRTSQNLVYFGGYVRLGGGGYYRHRFGGDIGEMLVYDRVLSPGERLDVEQYLAVKYGLIDSDLDGLPDWRERELGTNPLEADSDGDLLSDTDEISLQTNPLAADSDGDGMPDGWEVVHGLDPRSAADANLDADGDGVPNFAEYVAGSDPRSDLPKIMLEQPAGAILVP